MLIFLLSPFFLKAQQEVLIYENDIVNSRFPGDKTMGKKVNRGNVPFVGAPSLEIYLSEDTSAEKTGILLIPGGGYSVIVFDGEGVSNAKLLSKKGYNAFVLKYRLPSDSTMIDKSLGPLQDAQQAMLYLRTHAKELGINPNKIGVMGFSAGGHLASTLATHFDPPAIEVPAGMSVRPDFQVLVYPVISMKEELTHGGSKKALLGNSPSEDLILKFSNEMQVNENTPPAYLTHSADDVVVDVDNSIEYFQALRAKKVLVEMHIYPKGNHGFIFRQPGWINPLFDWLEANGW